MVHVPCMTTQMAKIPATIANIAATPPFETKDIAADEGVELSAAAELDSEELVGTELDPEVSDGTAPVVVPFPVPVVVVVPFAVPLVGVALPLVEVKVIVILLTPVGVDVGVRVVRAIEEKRVRCQAFKK